MLKSLELNLGQSSELDLSKSSDYKLLFPIFLFFLLTFNSILANIPFFHLDKMRQWRSNVLFTEIVNYLKGHVHSTVADTDDQYLQITVNFCYFSISV